MKTRHLSRFLFLSLAPIAAASCATPTASAPAAPPPAAVVAAAPAPAPAPALAAAVSNPNDPMTAVGPPTIAWKDMTKEQKNKFMKVVVTPRMKEVFQAYDATEYKVFGCKTCHGKDPKAVDFKMPSADLHVLPATREGFAELMQKEPKAMKFMAGEVKPKMAALLGLEDFRPDNPKPDAFGCHGCHTSKTQ